MKLLLKQGILFLGILGITGTTTYFATSSVNTIGGDSDSGYTSSEPYEMTHQERLLSSLSQLETFEVDANLEIVSDEFDMIFLNIIDAEANLSNLDDLQLQGDLTFKVNDFHIKGSLGYYDENIYLSYSENYFKLQSSNLLNFIDLLPSYGFNMQLPEELTELSLSSIESEILNMEERQTPDGGVYFVLNLSDLIGTSNDIELCLKANSNYEFTGLFVQDFIYEGSLISIDASIKKLSESTNRLADPKDGEDYDKYQNFEPAFDLFNSMYNLFNSPTNGVMFDLSINQDDNGVEKEVIDAEGSLNYDFNNNEYGLQASIIENESIPELTRRHSFDLSYVNSTIYSEYNSLKLSLEKDNLVGVMEYFLDSLSQPMIDDMLNGLTSEMEGVDPLEILAKVTDLSQLLSTITIAEDKVAISIDPTIFGLEADVITITTNFNKDKLLGLSIDNVNISGIMADFSLTLVDYVSVQKDFSEFIAIEPAFGLVSAASQLSDDDRFSLAFDASVASEGESAITADGSIQFDIENKFGYGETTITDRSSYRHNVKIDVTEFHDILFSYNDSMKGKLNLDTTRGIVDVIVGVVESPDDHFKELFGDLLERLANAPLMQIINNQDIGLLASTNIINDLSISDGEVKVNVSGALMGLDDMSFDLTVTFDENNINNIAIDNLVIAGMDISLNVQINEYNELYDTVRLDPAAEYIDFSDVKSLLELGINTSEFNYYHLSGEVEVELLSIFTKEVPLDIKIRNNKGDVQIAIEMSTIPLIDLLVYNVNKNDDYKNTRNRSASIYIEDGVAYVYRQEEVGVKSGFLGLGTSWKDYSLTRVCDMSYFFSNILNILCEDIMGFSSSIMKQINSSSPSESHQIKYENVLNNFASNSSTFTFDINLAEIASNDDLTKCFVTVNANTAEQTLRSIRAELGFSVGITINLDLNLTLVDKSIALNDGNKLTKLESFVAKNSSLTRNVAHIVKP